ncbi:EAL domain-containing protein [Ruminococcus flavefaciens]|uniref:EAL domain-containing protein n=1 Tax=Ruminococcus flavefaciens TaxID=1265 RepID=UPI0026F21C73|nr:EAL domain-containing protein [Ruminococcus flavefaciens]
MFTASDLNLGLYSPVGDITVMALCIIMGVFIKQSYIGSEKKKFRIIMCILTFILISAMENVGIQMLLKASVIKPVPIYIMRLVHHVLMMSVIYLYIQYLRDPLWVTPGTKKQYQIISVITLLVAAVFDIAATVFKVGFYVGKNGEYHSSFDVFELVYMLLIITVVYILIKYKARLLARVFWGIMCSIIIANVLLCIQMMHRQVSYTTLSFFLPVVGIIFMFHSNPFNVDTGAVSSGFFANEIKGNIENGRETLIMCCHMNDFSRSLSLSPELKSEFYKFFRMNVKKGILYSFPSEHYVLTIVKNKRTNYDKAVEKMLNDFLESHSKFKIDYKIVIMETCKDILSVDDYYHLIEYCEMKMQYNTIYRISEQDIKEYYDKNYILSQLEDIANKKDLSDPRVLVYCQPVYNIKTKIYDTAEALMRLKLEKTGMVFPDQFIPLAEQFNLIHYLSMIILNKTCYAIRGFIEEGYRIKRVSVNFSAIDIRYDTFCNEVKTIIDRNGINYDKIAVEITESRSEADFNLMKQRVMQLQDLGIKFYLDDFGTGYSNFERIMEIPFDIIKFDRSMLMESHRSDSSQYMVKTFANMFYDLRYAVLFEGVENDSDEDRCIMMKAQYLQGYKYSKPIPIEELKTFLDVAVNQ